MVILKSVKTKVETYESKCSGRNYKGKPVFDDPVTISIIVSSSDSNPNESVSVDVGCPYNLQGHGGHNCNSAHPHTENFDVSCQYAISLPCGESFLLEHKKERAVANKDLAEIAKDTTSALHPWRHLFE